MTTEINENVESKEITAKDVWMSIKNKAKSFFSKPLVTGILGAAAGIGGTIAVAALTGDTSDEGEYEIDGAEFDSLPAADVEVSVEA